jgi:hypothetical protein
MGIDLKESKWARACKETEKFRKDSPYWYWGVEVVGAVLFAGIGLLLAPDQPTEWQSVLYPGIGLIAGFIIIALVVFGWNLFRTPYRQLNEAWALLEIKPKPAQLSNRKELISAIHQLKETAGEVILTSLALRHMDSLGKEPPLSFVTNFSTAFGKYQEAQKELECQELITAEIFHDPINIFRTEIDSCVQTPAPPEKATNSDAVNVNTEENTSKLYDALNKVVSKINEISQ